MSDPLLPAVITVLAGLVAGLWAWHRYHHRSFWLIFGYPSTAIAVRFTWRRVALGCGLTKKRERFWFTLTPNLVPSTGIVSVRRRFQKVGVDTKPWMWWPLPTRYGWRVTVWLLEGQVPSDYTNAAEQLAHAWGVHAVRVSSHKRGRVVLNAIIRDPSSATRCPPSTRSRHQPSCSKSPSDDWRPANRGRSTSARSRTGSTRAPPNPASPTWPTPS